VLSLPLNEWGLCLCMAWRQVIFGSLIQLVPVVRVFCRTRYRRQYGFLFRRHDSETKRKH
jgi:hypothetical protein